MIEINEATGQKIRGMINPATLAQLEDVQRLRALLRLPEQVMVDRGEEN